MDTWPESLNAASAPPWWAPGFQVITHHSKQPQYIVICGLLEFWARPIASEASEVLCVPCFPRRFHFFLDLAFLGNRVML